MNQRTLRYKLKDYASALAMSFTVVYSIDAQRTGRSGCDLVKGRRGWGGGCVSIGNTNAFFCLSLGFHLLSYTVRL